MATRFELLVFGVATVALVAAEGGLLGTLAAVFLVSAWVFARSILGIARGR